MFTDQAGPELGHRGLLDALSDAVLVLDPTGIRIIDANLQARKLMGISTDQMKFIGLAADIITSSPIGEISGLEALLSRGEGSLEAPGKEMVGPFLVEMRPFVENESKRALLTIRKVDSNERTKLELDHLRKEQSALMETTTDLVFSVNRSGSMISVNRAVRGLGYREEEIIGANISSFVVASHREETSKLLDATFSGARTEQPHSIEVLAKDGEVHLLKVTGRLVMTEGDKAQVQCIARDVTPLVEADKALGESLWQYKSLFENAHVAMWEIDAFDAIALAREIEREMGTSIQEAIARDPRTMMRFMAKLRFIDVNRECLDLFHAKNKEEFYGRHYKMFPEESLPALSEWVGSMLVGDSGMSMECIIKTMDGEDRSVELRWGRLQSRSKDQSRILVSFVDTTDKMSAFKQLESEKHFGDAIIDFAETLIIGMDMDGTVTIFNHKAEQSTGLRREEVLGKNYFALFDPEVDAEGGKAWLADMAKGQRSVERIKLLAGKGASPTIWWHNTVVESGDRLVMISIGVDITERMSLNRRLEDLNESLLLLNRIMRHDIMNDLSVALGSIQLYEKKREGRFLEAATHSLTKSVDLIHDISDLERLRAPTELRSVKVRDVIDKVVANRAGQNVLIRVSGEGIAMADETLSSVIDNLVGNAIMHGHTETVDIDIRNDEGQCLVRVADHGKGVPDDIKARVFDEGFKFGETGNTGFGLYIVKKTMERYGGSVIVKDNQPQGAVFELRLQLLTSI
ncbi:MAG: PAS domain S-box protein [Methanomassiliicoccales archaeon]